MLPLPPWESAIIALAGPCAELFITDEVHRSATILGGEWPSSLADEDGFSIDECHRPGGSAAARALAGGPGRGSGAARLAAGSRLG